MVVAIPHKKYLEAIFDLALLIMSALPPVIDEGNMQTNLLWYKLIDRH